MDMYGQESAGAVGTAFVVQPVLSTRASGAPSREVHEILEEAQGLARAISLDVLQSFVCKVPRVRPAHFLGKGAVEDIRQAATDTPPTVIIVNHTLSPVQQRTLEREWSAKVIDRTGLILEIFGARAQTREGRIQVELARLEYQKSRLVRSWTHLERQRGGGGFLGGPGETQLEIDRRIISDRIARLKKDIEDVRRTRDLARRSREKVPFPVIALVGYTNAGKSTLFNRITGANVFAEDLPFATLDPTMRRCTLPDGQVVIFSDTVGFIADLPTHLVAAFRATLEQVRYADIIIHVRDMSRPDREDQKRDVESILHDLGVNADQDSRLIEAWNKMDAVSEEESSDLRRRATFDPRYVCLSALTGAGTEDLLQRIAEKRAQTRRTLAYHIPAADGKALAWLHAHTTVLGTEPEPESHPEESPRKTTLRVSIGAIEEGRFRERFGYEGTPQIDPKDDEEPACSP